MKRTDTKDIHRIFVEKGHVIDEALQQGVREAAVRHKEKGVPMVVYEDGKIVSVPADEVIAANTPREPRKRRRA